MLLTKATGPDKVEKPLPLVPEKSPLPQTHPSKKSKPLEKCRVTFDYQAENNDELTLVKGEIVTIIDKNAGDAGWWIGETVDEDGK